MMDKDALAARADAYMKFLFDPLRGESDPMSWRALPDLALRREVQRRLMEYSTERFHLLLHKHLPRARKLAAGNGKRHHALCNWVLDLMDLCEGWESIDDLAQGR